MAGFLESLAKGDIAGAAGAAVEGATELATGKKDEAERQAAALKAQAEAAAARARQTGSAVMSAITGEEAPRELTANEVKEVQSALGLGTGAVGPKTRAGVTEFAKAHGIDPATVISADQKHLIGTPEFLGAIEADRHVDLEFYDPTPAVQKQVINNLDKLRQGAADLATGARQKLDQGLSAIGGVLSSEDQPDGPQPNDKCRALAAEYRESSGLSALGISAKALTGGCNTNVPPFKIGGGGPAK